MNKPSHIQWIKDHPEKVREYSRAYRLRHPIKRRRSARRYAAKPEVKERRRLKAKAYRLAHRERDRKRLQAWRKAHPGKVKKSAKKSYKKDYAKAKSEYVRRAQEYRARRSSAPAVDFTKQEWIALIQIYKNRCAYCNKKRKMTQDHVLPLSKGGSHTKSNIVPACCSCNAAKRDRIWTPRSLV